MRRSSLGLLLAAAIMLSGCGVGVQLDQTAGSSGAETAALSEADIRATVEAEFEATARAGAGTAPAAAASQLSEADIRATVEAEYQATAQAAASAAPAASQLGEADIRATVEAEFQATASARAATASTPAEASGGAAETVPTPSASAAPEAQPVAQTQTQPAMLLLLDSSGSMLLDSGDGRDKLTAAKDALKTLVDALPDGAPVGLRVYGHRFPNTDKPNSCQDSELVQPVGPLDKNTMKGRIDSFGANGYTPIALSLEQGYNDLPPEGVRTMVLVSDGEETCDRDPCQVARDLEAKGVDLVIEPIGFQVDDVTRAQLQCIAEATGGQYRDAANAAELADRLKEISSRALREYQPVGGEVFGGPDYRNALALQPGEYIEKLRLGETVYYKVNLPAGKRLKVVTTLVPPELDINVGNLYLAGDFETEDRGFTGAAQGNTVSWSLNNPPDPSSFTMELDSDPNANRPQEPGEYFLIFALKGSENIEELRNVDVVAEFVIELE